MTAALTAPHQHTNFSRDRFVGYDFDGTVARTSDPSPHNVTVASAYDTAIDQVFGSQALARYHANGGLGNRAPIEVVRQLAPDATASEQTALLAQLDGTKLAVLLDEITPQWPQPTPGYLEFAQRLQSGRERGYRATDAIISSGHEPFIAKTYDVWGVQKPTILLAQGAISAMAAAENLTLPVKPSVAIMRFAHTAWRAQYGLEPTAQIPADEATRMSYTGDDSIKDGEMAIQSGVAFFLLNPADSQPTWNRLACSLGMATLSRKNHDQK